MAVPLAVINHALEMLLEEPNYSVNLDQCQSRLWSTQSANQRFYCAQILVDEGTPETLRRGIYLVNAIATDHPLRPESDRLVAQWSQNLLEIAEQEFQQGHLDYAIELAEQVPINTVVRTEAEARVKHWESLWREAEDVYADAQTSIERERWHDALEQARSLLQLENDYWQTMRYEELVRELQTARENYNWRERQAEEAEERDRNRVASVDEMLFDWERERIAEDLEHLNQAQAIASAGGIENLEAAISEARQVIWGTEHYEAAQSLISDWRSQIEQMEDQPYLDRAAELANQGDPDALRDAIDEASRIPSYRSLYPEAQRQIDQWQAELETMAIDELAEPELQPNSDDDPTDWQYTNFE